MKRRDPESTWAWRMAMGVCMAIGLTIFVADVVRLLVDHPTLITWTANK